MAQKNTKQNMSVLLTKLGDRDTFTMASRELDSMARNIDPTGNLHSFISVILSADSGDKPAVRKHCIHLLAVLSLSLPPNSLSPFLSKILTGVLRRLRDRDSSVRSACVAAVSAIVSRTTRPPFSEAFLKPLSEALFTETEVNAQIGAGLCLAAAIDAAEDPDPVRLGEVLLPKVERLVRCKAFKAKSAGVVVIGSVIGAGGVGVSGGGLKMVKAVRDVMNQMIEAWRQVPDLSEEVSPPRSNASSKGDACDGRYPFKSSRVVSTPGKPRTTSPGSSLATTTARKRTNVKSSDQRKTSLPSRAKSNVRRRLDWKAGGGGEPLEEESLEHNENTKEVSYSNQEKMQKLGSVVLSENQNSFNCQGFEDMSLIRSQLVQIEQQQSNLMDLLQRFVGSSEHGMRALETRVQGLELAMDEISYDMAVSNRRMSNNCCLIPPGSFIRSKFWKKPDQQHSASRLATHRNRNAQTMGMQDSRQRFSGAAGFIVNPLAETRPDHGSRGLIHN
ncbi:unnamed protein product [Eruca vesicaria subsp. sativa]|uniref:TORTIFOLIA1/SINE1-2 N-terminal domain-containing protein n=1 Tax=Eruca vesicaria subsp. sativa TaxID=29727 RepID=A0ABC8K5X6_ERUVS|nr:unnamed protein product [Eruca vesicaria subsp. sativa]